MQTLENMVVSLQRLLNDQDNCIYVKNTACMADLSKLLKSTLQARCCCLLILQICFGCPSFFIISDCSKSTFEIDTDMRMRKVHHNNPASWRMQRVKGKMSLNAEEHELLLFVVRQVSHVI
jgi:hypothetical protein